jgi:hypothetical protein
VVTCGAAGFNTNVVHIEMAGPFSWKVSDWKRNIATMRRCAWLVAWLLVRLDLPCRHLSASDLKKGLRKGYTSHREVTYSGVASTTHTDPVNVPTFLFRGMVKRFYRRFKEDGLPRIKTVR